MTLTSNSRRAFRVAFLGVGLPVALFGVASLFVELRYKGRIHGVADAPSAPVAIVFGAGLGPGRAVSPLLAERLDAAVALLAANKVSRLFLSGDNSSDRYHDEPGAMMRYLTSRGVPSEKISSDPLGLSTYASCYRAYRLFGMEKALLVTQDFHLPRALFIANGLGMDAFGVAADEPRGKHTGYELRELFSRPLALGMVLFRPEPKAPARKP
jgi:vancomycin permeability regulator SanA